ncbi:MAG TPA: hypothetical protein VHZ24_14915 [Pirellulales bacterium]|jgi:type IV pilus assembly protein PilQ|nr:hypothetical protein [Pirellulales bacterium]
MNKPLGIALLLVCSAVGVALAVGLAITLVPNAEPALVAAAAQPSEPKPKPPPPKTEESQNPRPLAPGESPGVKESNVEPAASAEEIVPVVATSAQPVAEEVPTPPPIAPARIGVPAKTAVVAPPAKRHPFRSNQPARTKATLTAAGLPGSTDTSGGLDLSSALQAFQNADPATQQQLRDSAGKLLDNPAQFEQLLQGAGLGNLLGNPQMLDQLRSAIAGGAQPPTATAPDDTHEELPQPAAPHQDIPVRPPLEERVKHSRGPEGDDELTITIQDEDLRQVLEFLSEQGSLNILASNNVQGSVSAVLKDVDVNAALDAIVKSSGFVMRREGKFVYVGTSKDFADLRMALDHVGTRVYRPNYVTAKELQALIVPLMTTGVGKVSITTPAQMGIIVDGNNAGGDTAAHGEAVLAQDYEAVLAQIDEVVHEIDRRPLQVHIEAMVIAVTLNDANQFGVNFQVLRNNPNLAFGSGTPRIAPIDGTGAVDPATGSYVNQYNFAGGGLQFAFLDASLGMFLTALETIGDINVIATPRLLCLNKQRAEILIGSQIPYTTSTVTQTFTTQTVQFLDIGTQLRLRPYISSDGSIRMEVHPEVSSEGPVFDNVPSKNLTQVTTNIMCYDGCTVVIGGLMQEDLQVNVTQIPFLGSLPGIGWAFRQKSDTNIRREILILVTPRIVYEPEYDSASVKAQNEFVERESVAADSQILIGRSVSARRFIRSAESALNAGNYVAARRYANLAVRFDPNNRVAIALRDEINEMQPKMRSVIDKEPPDLMPGGTVPTVPRPVPPPPGERSGIDVAAPVGPGPMVPDGFEPIGPGGAGPDGLVPPLLPPGPIGPDGLPIRTAPVRPVQQGISGRSVDIPKPGAFNDAQP